MPIQAPFPLANLPTEPGVYLYKNQRSEIIYIGKAKHLKKRVSQYFQKTKNQSLKTQFLVKNITAVETIITNNEVEALLLENKLIKQHKPKYNISLKDSKTYAYIKITDEDYPKIITARNARKSKNHPNEIFFGPFTSGFKRKTLTTLANKLFKLRTCKNLPKRACLNYHIGLCSAPCINKVNKQEYQSQVNHAKEFLKGDTKTIQKKLESDMKLASKQLRFEKALEIRDQIYTISLATDKQTVDLIKNKDQDIIAIESDSTNTISIISLFQIKRGVISGKKDYRFENEDPAQLLEEFITLYYSQKEIPNEIIINKQFYKNNEEKETIEKYLEKIKGMKVEITLPQRGQKLKLIQLAQKNAKHALENTTLKQSQENLNLPEEPNIIECFDISNLGSEHVVAGMTQFRYGKPNKSAYRKFEIQVTKQKGTHDDFASMYEAVYRRYKRLKKDHQENPNSTSFPQLIIIDGGKGQLGMALKALKTLSLHIPIIGLAKQEEEIFLPSENEPRKYLKQSPMMLMIRKIRDATHDYVISYNKKKRQMKMKKDFENAQPKQVK